MGRRASLKPKKDSLGKSWYVGIPPRLSSTGKYRREFFPSKAKVQERIKELKTLAVSENTSIACVSPKLVREAVECEQIAKQHGYSSLREAVLTWTKSFEKQKDMITLEELMDYFRIDREANWSKGYQSSRWKPFYKFLAPIKDEPISELTTDFWREWLGAWVEEKNPAPNTYNPRLTILRSLFRHEKAREHFVHNPIEPIVALKGEQKEVCVASVDEVKILLNWCKANDPEILPYFAIGFFAGLRPMAELETLKFEQINYEAGVISVITTKTANRRRRQAPIEENLKQWLEPYINETGLLCPTNFRKRILKARKESDITWGHDIMRHSYGSYWEAKHRKEKGCREQLAYNMGHSSFKTFEQYYRNDRSEEDALNYWKI